MTYAVDLDIREIEDFADEVSNRLQRSWRGKLACTAEERQEMDVKGKQLEGRS